MNVIRNHRLPIFRLPIPGKSDHPIDVEAELARFEAAERERLGLDEQTRYWTDEMVDAGFSKSEKATITLLVGGLTIAQDFLIEAAVARVGYHIVALDRPDNDSLRYGKEFGNRAQCNPTYYTVGNLVKYLVALRDKGMTSEEIIGKFVFVTAGSCGPCRFGMYATEYRKALRDAGFDGFRVMLFQEKGGIDQATGEESGLDLSPRFFIAVLQAVLVGDILNGMGYRIRPYELEPGATDRAIEDAKQICYDAFNQGRPLLPALHRAKRCFERVAVDHLRVRPVVGITGEFWAMTTEGEGNYFMQRFLEQEGAEVRIQFVSEWLLYNVWEEATDLAQREHLREHDPRSGIADKGRYGVVRKKLALWAAEKAVRAVWTTYSTALGYRGHRLHDIEHGRKVAEGLYSSELRGGEGHMEVAKTIDDHVNHRTNMTLSVKPFGCMPSSAISDGVQSAVAERYPGTIFCSVETSGDGAVNFYSRVQMFLFKAQAAADRELEAALAETGLSAAWVRTYVAKTPALASSLYVPRHRGRYACKAANMVLDVHEHMQTSRRVRATQRVRNFRHDTRALAGTVRAALPGVARNVAMAGREIGEEVWTQIRNRVTASDLMRP